MQRFRCCCQRAFHFALQCPNISLGVSSRSLRVQCLLSHFGVRIQARTRLSCSPARPNRTRALKVLQLLVFNFVGCMFGRSSNSKEGSMMTMMMMMKQHPGPRLWSSPWLRKWWMPCAPRRVTVTQQPTERACLGDNTSISFCRTWNRLARLLGDSSTTKWRCGEQRSLLIFRPTDCRRQIDLWLRREG